MAIPLMNLPAYNAGNSLLNLEPIQQALSQKIRMDQMDMENQFKQRQLDMSQRQLDDTSKRQQAEAFGNKALAFAQLPENQRDPAAWDRILREHPDYKNLPQQYRDPVRAPNMVAAEFGKWRSTLDDDLKRAQIGKEKAHADYYRSAGAAKQNVTTPVRSGPVGVGMDAEGNIILAADEMEGGSGEDGRPYIAESRVLGSAQTRRPEVQFSDATSRLPAGTSSSTVPGVVVDVSGNGGTKASPYASRQAQLNEAERRASPEDQARLREFQNIQDYWTSAYRRPPPAGMIYTKNGGTQPLADRGSGGSPTQKAAQGALENAQEALAIVHEALVGRTIDDQPGTGNPPNLVQRGVSQVAGSGTFDRALKILDPAVRAIMHGMSGAQVNIPETQAYFNAFMPRWNDDPDTQSFKIKHMMGVIAAIRQVTAKPDDKEALEKLRAEMRTGIREGLGLKKDAPSKGANPYSGMSDDEIKRKLGIR